jgi:hypothetical protein
MEMSVQVHALAAQPLPRVKQPTLSKSPLNRILNKSKSDLDVMGDRGNPSTSGSPQYNLRTDWSMKAAIILIHFAVYKCLEACLFKHSSLIFRLTQEDCAKCRHTKN